MQQKGAKKRPEITFKVYACCLGLQKKQSKKLFLFCFNDQKKGKKFNPH